MCQFGCPCKHKYLLSIKLLIIESDMIPKNILQLQHKLYSQVKKLYKYLNSVIVVTVSMLLFGNQVMIRI